MSHLRIGMIGLDTSHSTAFTKLLQDSSNEHHVPGARVVAAFAGGSPDFHLSINRLPTITEDVRKLGVQIVPSISDLREQCDAILLESVDGRVHLEQFRQIADWGKPVFIDKPLAVTHADAAAILDLAQKHNTPVMTCSALRYAQTFQETLAQGAEDGEITGSDFYGPMALEPCCPGFFWYGIHTVEMLFAAMGDAWVQVQAERHGDHDLIRAMRADGSFGTLRGNRTGNVSFGGVVHRSKRSLPFDVSTGTQPFYAGLLQRVIPFFAGAPTPISLESSVRLIAFIEAANASVEAGGKPVRLDQAK